MNTKPPHVSTWTGCEAEVVVGAGRELLGVEHETDRPVEVPPPAVERADQRADAAASGGEAGAAVTAGVEVAADRVGRFADDEDRVRRRSGTRT